jgi:hypothetical protein
MARQQRNDQVVAGKFVSFESEGNKVWGRTTDGQRLDISKYAPKGAISVEAAREIAEALNGMEEMLHLFSPSAYLDAEFDRDVAEQARKLEPGGIDDLALAEGGADDLR